MLNFVLKTIVSFIFLFGRSWLTVRANKLTAAFSHRLDTLLLWSVRLLHATNFCPNSVRYRGPCALLDILILSFSNTFQGLWVFTIKNHKSFWKVQGLCKWGWRCHRAKSILLPWPASSTPDCSTGIWLQLQHLNPFQKWENNSCLFYCISKRTVIK